MSEIDYSRGWTEVYSVSAGALDESLELGPDGDVQAAIEQLAANGADEVYILPHYCNPELEEPCECVQWLLDHRPAWSREDQDEEDADAALAALAEAEVKGTRPLQELVLELGN
jgi:hypothetical protein